MAAMCGWLSEARTCASRLNRARRLGSRANASGSTFSATSLARFVSRARYTSPMPPLPISETISYGPSLCPRPRDTPRAYHHGELLLADCCEQCDERLVSAHARGADNDRFADAHVERGVDERLTAARAHAGQFALQRAVLPLHIPQPRLPFCEVRFALFCGSRVGSLQVLLE